jgi:hypothetical protein
VEDNIVFHRFYIIYTVSFLKIKSFYKYEIMQKLENKVAIIPDGSRSIGKITGKIFLEEGAKVMLLIDNSQFITVNPDN